MTSEKNEATDNAHRAFGEPFRFYSGMSNPEIFEAAFAAWSAQRQHGDVNCQGAFRKGWIAGEAAKVAELLGALEHLADVMKGEAVKITGLTGDLKGGFQAVVDAALAKAKSHV